jgi:hypothetical protein
MIDDLSRASAEGRLRDALLTYLQPHVLVVDEVGYLTYGTTEPFGELRRPKRTTPRTRRISALCGRKDSNLHGFYPTGT